MNLFEQSGAEFSDDNIYRYKLWRTWDEARPSLNVLMLNPSTADAERNDPTVERCERRARREGYSGLVVTNLFAYRATDPRDMLAAGDPVGPRNDEVIRAVAASAGLTLCAWGVHGAHQGRADAVVQMLLERGVTLHALRLTADGQPCHPLYLPNELEAFTWKRP